MKNLILVAISILLLMLAATSAVFAKDDIAIDEKNFPDAKFRAYVSETADTDNDGLLSPQEIASVRKIDVSWKGIANLKGIEFFTAVKELNCYYCGLTSLDVSHNPALEILECSDNQLDSLKLNNPALKEFKAAFCFNSELTELDISQSTALEIFLCDFSKLAELDVSKNIALKSLSLSSHNLTALDVSKNPALTTLYVGSMGLGALDVSHNPVLESLSCSMSGLTELDVSANPKLEYLSCSANKLTTIDVSHNPALKTLDVAANHQLTELDITHNPALEELYCSRNQISALDLSHNPALKELYCAENQLTMLDVSHNPALEKLDCSENQLSSLDVSRNIALTILVCSFNRLATLDLSQNTVLEEFICAYNDMKSDAAIMGLSKLALRYFSFEPQLTAEAIPSRAAVLVDGKPVEFNAYLIHGNNYFKLRDLAFALNGSRKQFNITWEDSTIYLIPGEAYTAVGSELQKGDDSAKTAVSFGSPPIGSFIRQDNNIIRLSAYTIDGNNYFRLRDVAEHLGITVTWDEATGTIGINTSVK